MPSCLLPLYKGAHIAPLARRGTGHAGLWWDKFCDRWNEWEKFSLPEKQGGGPFQKVVVTLDEKGQPKETRTGKADWILSLVRPRTAEGRIEGTGTVSIGEPGQLKEMHERRQAMLKALGGRPLELALLEAPFVTGTGLNHPVENGFLWHHSLGVPYLPGSGVKGLTRSWAEIEHGPDRDDPDVRRVFGPEGRDQHGVGSVIFLDAVPAAPVELVMEVMTPHYLPWYQKGDKDPRGNPPADWYDPTPIPFLAVKQGAVFLFAVLPRRPGLDDGDAEMAAGWLEEALNWLGAGAKTAVGFGRFGEPSKAATEQRAETVATAATDPALARRFRRGEYVEAPDGTEVEVVGIVGEMVEVLIDDEGTRRRYRPDQLRGGRR